MKVVLTGVLLLLAGPLAAQQDSTLRLAMRLVTEGQGDSARALVRTRLTRTPASDSLYPEILYTAGVVAADADSALRYFRQTSIEYSQSPWADRALLRIAQMAFAGGDLNGTVRSAQRVLTDYPLSTVRPQAAFWAGRAHLDLGDVGAACGFLAHAADSAGADVELANRARFYLQRCQMAPLARPDTVRPDTSITAPARPAAAPVTYAVQISAVRSAASADQAMQSARRAGYDPRVVRDADGFLKVRVGRFRTRPEAQRLATELRRRMGGTPFVVEEP